MCDLVVGGAFFDEEMFEPFEPLANFSDVWQDCLYIGRWCEVVEHFG